MIDVNKYKFEVVDFSGADGGLYTYFVDYLNDFYDGGIDVQIHSSKTERAEIEWPNFIEISNAFGRLKISKNKLKKAYFFLSGLLYIFFKKQSKKRIINIHAFDLRFFTIFSMALLKLKADYFVLTLHDVTSFRKGDGVSFLNQRIRFCSYISNLIICHSKEASSELIKRKISTSKIFIKKNENQNFFITQNFKK